MSLPRRPGQTARERAIRADAWWGIPPGSLIDDQIYDGEIIATAAIRLAVKNDLILRALGDREDYDDAALAEAVRRELLALAAEKLENAQRIKGLRRRIRWRWGKARRHHDYRRADLELVRRRQEIDDGLAARLRQLSHDDAYITGVVAAARAAALDEIARWARDRAASLDSTGMVDDLYEQEREERTRLVLTDLAELQRARGEDSRAPAS